MIGMIVDRKNFREVHAAISCIRTGRGPKPGERGRNIYGCCLCECRVVLDAEAEREARAEGSYVAVLCGHCRDVVQMESIKRRTGGFGGLIDGPVNPTEWGDEDANGTDDSVPGILGGAGVGGE